MTGVALMNPLTSTVLNIRKAATHSFQNGFDLLDENEKSNVLFELNQFHSMLKRAKSIENSGSENNKNKSVVD